MLPEALGWAHPVAGADAKFVCWDSLVLGPKETPTWVTYVHLGRNALQLYSHEPIGTSLGGHTLEPHVTLTLIVFGRRTLEPHPSLTPLLIALVGHTRDAHMYM